MNDKKFSLLRLLNSYPSFLSNDQTTAASVLASLLEVLNDFPDDIVERACLLFRRKPSAFAPSSGELYEACDRLRREAFKQAEFEAIGRRPLKLEDNRFNPIREHYTDEQLADLNLLINHTSHLPGHRYYVRPGFDYGYITPAEAEWIAENRTRKPETKQHWYAAE